MKNEVKNVLFVCTGNTCRSAMAQAVFNKLSAENNLQINAASAGIFAASGQPASQNALMACAGFGANLQNHRARQINPEIIKASDLIVPISASHKNILLDSYKLEEGKIFKSGMDIADPYMGSLEDYEKCLKEIITLCEKVIVFLS